VIKVSIIGAAGRMGQALVRAAAESAEMRVVGAVDSTKSSAIGQDIGDLAGLKPMGVSVGSDLAAALFLADVAVDFSHASAIAANLAACRAAHKPLLIGTTGFDAETAAAFDTVARDIPLLVAPNTSIGVTLLIELVRTAAQALPPEFDIEIIEAHHRMKRDAPSGTALALGKAAAEGRDQQLDQVAVNAHQSGTLRREGQIGFAVLRGGDIVGDHSVVFAGTGERVSLSHLATDRAIFARGALKAAAWLAAQPPGRYFMRDIFPDKIKT
jgi:4-hydroxy-tetrahydrodipicolinate reductase